MPCLVPPAAVAQIKAAGVKVLCYFEAVSVWAGGGEWESGVCGHTSDAGTGDQHTTVFYFDAVGCFHASL